MEQTTGSDTLASDVVYVDFDGTLVKTNSILYLLFIRSHCLKYFPGLLNLCFWLFSWLAIPLLIFLHKLHEPSRDRLTYFLYFGLSEKQINGASQAFWQYHGKKVFRSEVIQLLQDYRNRRFYIVIVSGSLKPIIKAALEYCGIDSWIDEYIAPELQFSTHSRTNGILQSAPNLGSEKVKNILCYEARKQLHSVNRVAVTDSSSDIPMIDFCQQIYVIHPKKDLLEMATQKGWAVIA